MYLTRGGELLRDRYRPPVSGTKISEGRVITMAPSADRCMGDPGWSSEDQDICSDAVHNLQARCSDGNELLSPWTDWVENGIEFFFVKTH